MVIQWDYLPSGKRLHGELGKSPALSSVDQLFLGAIFNRYASHYQSCYQLAPMATSILERRPGNAPMSCGFSSMVGPQWLDGDGKSING